MICNECKKVEQAYLKGIQDTLEKVLKNILAIVSKSVRVERREIMNSSVRDIVIEFLKKNGYDGIVNPDEECGCGIDELFLCDNPECDNCYAAQKQDCKTCTEKDCDSDCKETGSCFKLKE